MNRQDRFEEITEEIGKYSSMVIKEQRNDIMDNFNYQHRNFMGQVNRVFFIIPLKYIVIPFEHLSYTNKYLCSE